MAENPLENSENDDNHWITEEILQQRLLQEESGSIAKQLLVTIAICFGSFSFGTIITWGGPAIDHIKTLNVNEQDREFNYIFLVSIAPMASAIGILVWAFFTRRIGPKKTILVQTPFLLLSWYLKAYFNTFQIYCGAHFLSGFCASCYLYAGEMLLIQSTHRKYVKIYFTLFRSCVMLGILSINLITKFFDKKLLSIICACAPAICFIMVYFLPESPVFLYMYKGESYAENAMKFYAGTHSYIKELQVIKQYAQLMSSAHDKHMLHKKVILKAVIIIFGLQVFRTMTGFYAFLFDSQRIFIVTNCIGPYYDNIVLGVVLFISRLVGTLMELYFDFGVKKPMMISMGFMAIILISLAFIVHYKINVTHKWVILVLISLFSIIYNIGMDIIPEIIIYEYMPYQIYDFIMRMMTVCHWIMILFIVDIYLWLQFEHGPSLTYWILAIITIVGLIYIGLFVIETKGKSLTQIQMELGGNSVGSRGSKRQRITNPFEPYEKANYLRNLITKNLILSNRRMALSEVRN